MPHAGGRPKKTIDPEQVEKLANMQCTQEEIASFFGVTSRTLQNKPDAMKAYYKGIENGRMSIRRMQWQALMEGDKTMLVWLGKQYLKQSDKHEVDDKHEVKLTVRVEDDE